MTFRDPYSSSWFNRLRHSFGGGYGGWGNGYGRAVNKRTAIIGVGLVGLAAVLAIWLFSSSDRSPLNIFNFSVRTCDHENVGEAHYLLADFTDRVWSEQQNQIEAVFQDVLDDEVGYCDAIHIFTLAGDPDVPLVLKYSGVSPRAGRDADTLRETPVVVQRSWEENFGGEVRQIISDDLVSPESERTYLIDAFEWAYQDFSMRYPNASMNFVIASDGMLNTQEFTAYVTSGPRYALDPENRATLLDRAPQMPNVRVNMAVILRPTEKDSQGRNIYQRQLQMMDFFEDWFEAAGIDQKSVRPLQRFD